VTAEHQVERIEVEHGASRTKRWRSVCSCGWLGGICAHWRTAEADGTDHLHEVAEARG
jgi:hypothetical protein